MTTMITCATCAQLRDECAEAAKLVALRDRQIETLRNALEGIFAQTSKHSRQWGQIESAAAFARDPDTAAAFATARAALAQT